MLLHQNIPLQLSGTTNLTEGKCIKRSNDNINDNQSSGKFTLHYSNLPRPQCAVRVASAPVDKWAKTAANNPTVTRAQNSHNSVVSIRFILMYAYHFINLHLLINYKLIHGHRLLERWL